MVLKLVQLNIWQGKLLKEVIDLLGKEDADIVCMQEVFSCDYTIAILDLLSSLERIQDKLDYPHVFFSPTFSFEQTGHTVHFGNAILSKLPLENQQTVFTNQQYHEVRDWVEHPPNTRNAQLAEITFEGKTLAIVNHHGYHENDPLGSKSTIESMRKLVNIIKESDRPIVFSGDLNITSESPAMRLFDGWMRDLTAEFSVADTLTRFGKVSGVPCDHILVTESINVYEFEVSERLVSDHKALILEFGI